MNKELEETVKYLKLHCEYNGILDKGRCIRIQEKSFTKTKQAIKTVLSYIEKSEKDLESKNRLLEITRIELNETEKQLENSIPKQVVEEKIEELKRQRRELGFKTYLKREDMLNDDRKIVREIEVLQELLEKRK